MKRLILVLIGVGVAGCCKKTPESGAPSGTSTTPSVGNVTAATLLHEYKDNEVRADAKYKGKRLTVSGVVGEIKKDFSGNPMVTIGTGAQLEIPTLGCSFDESSVGKIASLSNGDKVTVECTCEGLSMMNVIMMGCTMPSTLDAAAGLSACKKIEASGAVSGCALNPKSDNTTFNCGTKKGTVMVQLDDAAYSKVLAGTSKMTNFDCFGSQKTRAVVCVIKGAAPDALKKVKAAVDAL